MKVFVLQNGDQEIVGVYRLHSDAFIACINDMKKGNSQPNIQRGIEYVDEQSKWTQHQKLTVINALIGEEHDVNSFPKNVYEFYDYIIEEHKLK